MYAPKTKQYLSFKYIMYANASNYTTLYTHVSSYVV